MPYNFWQTPFGQDISGMSNTVGRAFMAPANSALNYFGLGLDPQSAAYAQAMGLPIPGASPGPAATPAMPMGRGASIADILGGGAGAKPLEFELPAFPSAPGYGRTRAAMDSARPREVTGPDYSRARTALEGAKPKGNYLKPEDEMAYILEGLGGAGLQNVADEDIGNIILAMGLGMLGGKARFKKDLREDERDSDRDMMDYQRILAGLEGDIAGAEFQARDTDETRRAGYERSRAEMESEIEGKAADYAMSKYETMFPKISQQHITQFSDKGDKLGVTVTPLPDPDLMQRAQFMALAGGAGVNPAAAIMSGKEVPGLTPEQQVQLRQDLSQKMSEIAESDQFKNLIMGLSASGMAKDVDATGQILRILDEQLMSIRPDLHAAMRQQLEAQQMMQGLGTMRGWR